MTDQVDDVFALLEADIAPALAALKAKEEKARLEKQANSPKSSHAQRVAAKKQLGEINETLEAAKWRPVALLAVSQHRVCKTCGSETLTPDGIFIQRETWTPGVPKTFSKKRIDLNAALDSHPHLPKRRVYISQQVATCNDCCDTFGWSDVQQPQEIIVLATDGSKQSMTAADFFGE
jgi:hypothetical protein